MKDSARVLVDTSAWIDYFRKREPCYSLVSALMASGRICCIGIVLAELIQGAKSDREVDVLKDFVQVFDFLPEDPLVWQMAGELSFSLRRRGLTVGLSDCLIAVQAMRSEAELLSLDGHFQQISEHSGLKLFRQD
ncbi:MAG: PIN domain-containing protein [Desulfofustis sp.]|nr:PIN domain-containing protein [Desulfofustis sp.]